MQDLDWDLDDLMKRSTELTGTEAPELEPIRRVTLKSIATVALIALLAYGLISVLTGISGQTLWDELKTANIALLLFALMLAPIAQIPQAFSTLGASLRGILFAPVLMLQHAVQFIELAVPSSAARVALEVRFFQRNGVDTGGALSIGLRDSLSGFAIQIMLILIIALSELASLDLSSSSSGSSASSSSSGPSLLLLAAGLLVLGGSSPSPSPGTEPPYGSRSRDIARLFEGTSPLVQRRSACCVPHRRSACSSSGTWSPS
jgi:hypothetical protein